MGTAATGDLDPLRLQALAQRLGQAPAAVARTLRDELLAARTEIDAGLNAGDLALVAHGAHGARNSALMVGAGPVLDGLHALETAAARGERRETAEIRERIGPLLDTLIDALG